MGREILHVLVASWCVIGCLAGPTQSAPAPAAAKSSAPAPAAPAAKSAPAAGRNVYHTPDSYTAAYHYMTCATTAQAEPASTQEVAALIAKHHQAARAGAPVTIRTSRPRFHSTATFVCPVSAAQPQQVQVSNPAINTEAGKKEAGAKGAPGGVGLLQTKLNKVVAVDPVKYTMRVGAGMTITELLREATKAKMSVQIGSLPAYAGLTLGGVLATSAHGSGDMTISSLADTVLEVTWVDGTGKVRVSKKGDPEFAAFNGGLGVFGVMTELLLQLTPPSNTQLITVAKKDTDLMQDINDLLKVAPHILIHWRPDEGSFKAFLTRKAPAGAKVNEDPALQMSVLPSTKGQGDSVRPFTVWHTTTEDDSDMMGFICGPVKEQSLSAAWASIGSGASAKKLDNVTAPTNRLAAAECDEECLWNNVNTLNGTAADAEFTIEFSQLADWIADVKKIFNTELFENGKKKYRCMGLGYIWIRFGSPYDGVTATPTGMKRPVYVQSTWMRAKVAPHYPMRFQYVTDLLEEVTLCKYKGRPHPGKNFDRTFLHPKCPVVPMYPRFSSLVALSKQYDPAGIFKPRLFDRMAAQGSFDLFPHCASLMKCYCSADIHCRPGEKCVPSLAFPQYKVCKHPKSQDQPGSVLALMMAADPSPVGV